MTLEETLKLMAKYRATRVKTGDLEVELSPLGFEMGPGVERGAMESEANDCMCGHPLLEHGDHGACLRGCGVDACAPTEARAQ